MDRAAGPGADCGSGRHRHSRDRRPDFKAGIPLSGLPVSPPRFYTNAGFIICGILLWLCWRRTEWYRSRTLIKSESERIALAGALVLGIAVSISGLAGFAVTTTQTENAISESLLLALKSRAELFTINIELHVGRARLIATRPALIAALRRLHSRPDDAAAIKQLQSAAQSFLPFGFDGITFYSPDDNKWTTAGKFAQYPALSVRLSMPYPAYLIWNDGFALTTSMPLLHDGQTVGYVVIEQSMQTLTEAMRTAPELGRTGETAVS